jgi:tRNA-Thr(GGU) m(6)t(6)A37 methyltransferase TsaA
MKKEIDYGLQPIGFIESSLTDRETAPSQGTEGAPDAWIVLDKRFAEGLDGIRAGDEVLVFTWFHQSSRDVLKLHPRWDKSNPLTGVFATRSPDRPNPIGLHPVTVKEIVGNSMKVSNMEALDGTPVIDLKPVI